MSLLMILFIGNVKPMWAQQKTVVDEVVWVVGDEAIFKSDIEAYIQGKAMEKETIQGDPYCTAAEDLALAKLFLHQADLDSITVPEEQLMQRVNHYIDSYQQIYGSREALETMAGMPISKMRENRRLAERNQYLIQAVRDKIVAKIAVTPAEVRSFFKEVPQDSIPFVPAQVEVEILSRSPEVSQTEIDRVKAELRDYTERINNGTPFSSLAILYSEDTGSARRGGELGFAVKGLYDPAFATVAWSLQDPKKVSKIVQSEYGYHIIQLIERRGDKVNCRHILRSPKIDDADIAKNLLRLDSVANDARSGKFSFEDAVVLISDDKETNKSNGLMQYSDNATGTVTSRFQMDQLPQEIAKVVDKMNVNEISKPFSMMNSKNKATCAIVKLKSRIPAHRASMSEDFQLLQEIVLQKRQADAIQKWIKEKQKKTFVRLNENWKKCDFKYPDWKF